MADTGIAAGQGWPVYLTETWILTGIAVLIILLRCGVRIRTVGFRRFGGDDYLTIGQICFTIMDAATVTVAFKKGQNVDLSESMISQLTEADIKRLTWGSKVELSAWYSYITLIWCLKFTLLFFYRRLTLGSTNAKLVKYLFWLIGSTYIAMFCIVTFGCWPYEKNWQVSPMAPWKCSFRPQNLKGTAVLNTTTDAALMVVPVLLIWQLKVPIKQKLVIALFLSSGLAVIAAAIVRAQLSLGTTPTAANINSWGVRETFIAVFTVNVPILRPVLNRSFWSWGPYNPTASRSKKQAYTTSGHATTSNGLQEQKDVTDVNQGDIELGHGTSVARDQIMKASQVEWTYQMTTEESDEDKLIDRK
ncbi:hypothetical protein K461DRAFT_292343 [Myriangium duriaei CBS 260.36]|uniref:Rhodopsin domain-containing protein n=1 Tax=Myriangium duriaei CBS 260.36 TaxID=1168546 RepID=A0A9P4J3W3_9PEZI|nr:hypothetical protein K461DRAFT_292343 [Myriangium duriaei CBS 260.36]